MMNRIIKFRAWNPESKQMIDLHKITPLALSDEMNTQLSLQGMDGLFIPFSDKFILMQFTGIKDKNGKEVYESDIISYNDFYEGDYKTTGGVGYVQWDEEGHAICSWGKDEEYICSTWDAIKNYGGTIIGNIYDNPKLLNQTT